MDYIRGALPVSTMQLFLEYHQFEEKKIDPRQASNKVSQWLYWEKLASIHMYLHGDADRCRWHVCRYTASKNRTRFPFTAIDNKAFSQAGKLIWIESGEFRGFSMERASWMQRRKRWFFLFLMELKSVLALNEGRLFGLIF